MPNHDVVDAYGYVEIGFHIRALLYTSSSDVKWVANHVGNLAKKLDDLGFTYPRDQLLAIGKLLDEAIRSSGEKTKMKEEVAHKLRVVVDCVHDTVKTQTKDQRIVLLLSSSVSSKLKDYARRGSLTPRQTYLYNEAVLSIETGAYRSAVVMGWNLAFDIIREWVFGDPVKLAAFNAYLSTLVNRAGNPLYDPIVQYSDFYEISEKVILDVCKGANLFGGNLYDDLRGYLRQRNSYAHASDFHPTVSQANGIIDHLIDAVVRLP